MTIRNVALFVLIALAGCTSCGRQEDQPPTNEKERHASAHPLPSGIGIDFEVSAPDGWGAAPLVGRMKWHVASDNGTALPDCLIIVTEDWSFQVISIDDYIENQSEAQFVKMASVMMSDVVVGVWEEDFRLGGQRALHIVYSATVDGVRQTSFSTQTIRSGKLYSFACNASDNDFPFVYADLLKIADTFMFVD